MELDPRQRIAVGNTSVVYGWGPGRVVKVFSRGVPDHWASREAAWTGSLHAAGLPVPEVHELTEVDGRPAIVYEHVAGPSVLDQASAPGADLATLAHGLAELQARLHAMPPPAGLPRLRDRLLTKIGEARVVDAATRRRAVEVLEGLDDGTALCHGDLHPGNVIVGAAGMIVVDWFDVAVGSPAADVARTSLLIRPRPRRGPLPHLSGISTAMLERFHDAYLEVAGVAAPSWRRWQFVVAVARLSEPGRHDDLDDLADLEAALPPDTTAVRAF